MTKFLSFTLGAGIALGLLLLFGCARPPSHVATTIPEGAVVSLVLLRQLESGKEAEGAAVTLMVADDVVDSQGRVVIPRGALASGRVIQSRGADAMSALTNRPARLAIEVDQTVAIDGKPVRLTVSSGPEEEDAYAFTRANTGRERASAKLDELAGTESGRRLLEGVASAFEGEGKIAETPESRELLKELAARLNLPDTKALIEQNEVGKANDLLSQITAAPGAKLLSGSSLAAVGAVLELANLAGDAGSRISRMLQGRNIVAHVGTPVQATVAAGREVLVPLERQP